MRKKCQIVMLQCTEVNVNKSLMIYKHIVDVRGNSINNPQLEVTTNKTFISNILLINSGNAATNSLSKYKFYNLYIISDDKPTTNEWCINKKLDTLYQISKPNAVNWFKVIATTAVLYNNTEVYDGKLPFIPQSFIHTYIHAYNTNNLIKNVLINITLNNLVKISTIKENYTYNEVNKLLYIAISNAIIYPETFITGICLDNKKTFNWIKENI